VRETEHSGLARVGSMGVADSGRCKEPAMITPGDTLFNHVTGEELTFFETAASTRGEYVELMCTVRPGGFAAAAHSHPAQSKTFTVVEGTLDLRIGRDELRVEPGGNARVAPGTAHHFWNDGAEPAVFRCVVRPALQFESLIETMFILAEEGRTNRRGMPNPVRMAAVAHAHRDVIRLAGVPAWMQDIGILAALPLAYVCGYTAPRKQTREARPIFAA
jgi:quercetin dioxygenase-like cupin family protein